MKLSSGKINTPYVITSIDPSDKILLELSFLGVMEGDVVTITHRAPFGSPLSIKHDRGSFFAIRKDQANFLEVQEILKEDKSTLQES